MAQAVCNETRIVFGEESAVCPDKPCLPYSRCVLLFQGKKCTTSSLFQFFDLERLFLAHRKQMFFPHVLGLDWDHSTAEE